MDRSCVVVEGGTLSADNRWLQVDSLVASDDCVQKTAQKHRSKSVKTWSGECAVRAGSLLPDSGAFFFIHGKTL